MQGAPLVKTNGARDIPRSTLFVICASAALDRALLVLGEKEGQDEAKSQRVLVAGSAIFVRHLLALLQRYGIAIWTHSVKMVASSTGSSCVAVAEEDSKLEDALVPAVARRPEVLDRLGEGRLNEFARKRGNDET